MWSRASTATPVAEPRIQWLGIGLGQSTSTVNEGAWVPCVPGVACSGERVLDRATSAVATVAVRISVRVRFIDLSRPRRSPLCGAWRLDMFGVRGSVASG